MIDNPQVAPTIRLSLHDSIHMIHREDWMQVAQGASPYLKYDHLLALEDAMCGTMDFHYAIYYCEQNQPMGIAYFQVADLVDNGSAYRAGVQKLGKGIGGRIAKEMKVRCLVNGNVFHCGDHGSYFKPGVSDLHRLSIVADTMRRLDKGCYFTSKASVLIVKDIWPAEYPAADALEDKAYAPLTMEPNMVLDLQPDWKDQRQIADSDPLDPETFRHLGGALAKCQGGQGGRTRDASALRSSPGTCAVHVRSA
jgi:hypothetical protein